MGAASSTGSAVLQSSAQKAAAIADLPQQILQTVFSSADFNDFLQLSTVAGCSKYVFQTKKAMDAVFTELRIEPTDTEGIYFAPVDRLTFTRKNNPTQAQDIQKRNTQCMKIAYFYIRLFQIYGALAITVLDTIPTREMTTGTVLRRGVTSGQVRKPLIGGGDADKQLTTGKESKLIKKLPSFIFTKLARLRNSETEDITISYPGKRRVGETDIINVEYIVADNETNPTAITIQGKHIVLVNGERKEIDSTLIFTFTDGKECVLTVNGKTVQPEFLYDISGIDKKWGYKDNNGKFITTFSDEFIESYMTDIFNTSRETNSIPIREQKTAGGKTGATAASTSTTTTSTSTAATATAPAAPTMGHQGEFLGLANLTKKLLRDKQFPKAYAVARAMQLLNPTVPGERVQGNAYTSDICRTSQTRMLFNTRDKEMPVIDSEANSSIYFVTLTSLFYDKLEIKPDGSPALSQTSPGREALLQASQQLGALFQFSQQDEAKFLFEKKRIPPLSVCKQFAVGGKITPVELQINIAIPQGKALVKELQGIVQQLLAHQQEHSKRVLQFYTSIFEKKKEGGWGIRNEIYRGGIPLVNRLAEQARNMLLYYYKKSEALYTLGYSRLYTARGILQANPLSSS